MNDKLEILCKQMHLTEEEQQYLENGILERIVGNKSHDEYRFYIQIEKTLPVSFYFEFLEKIKKAFPTCRKVYVTFQVEKQNEAWFSDYYYAFLKEEQEENPLISLLLESKVSYEGNWATIVVSNKAEEMKLKTMEETLIKKMNHAGYQNIKLEIQIDENRSLEMQQEIQDNLVEEMKKVEATPIEVPQPQEEPKKNFYQKGKRKAFIDRSNPNVVIGRTIDTEPIHIHDIVGEMNHITIEGTIFGKEVRDTKTGLKIVTLKVTDYTDSIYVKLFINDEEEANEVLPKIKEGNFYLFRGNTKDDQYSKELTFGARDILLLEKKAEERKDTAPADKKRVELHAHTKMSQMDGVADAKALLKQAQKWGHRAIAITDHNGGQAFPDVYHYICDVNKNLQEGEEPFKAIYGTELTMIDDQVNIVVRPNDSVLLDNTYVVFDFETTGFNAGGGDSIIEVGAVKIKDGNILERYDELINPGRKLPQKIVDITNITDEMLQDKDNEENAIKRFIEWFGDLPMVAHNAKFDVSFLEMAYQKYNLGQFTNPVIDTLELSRTLDNTFARHSLSALVKRYNVPWDENAHHRGDYDAEGTALVFHKMMKKLSERNLEKMTDLDKLVSKDEIHKYGRPYHINILVKNKVGLKNLFRIISLANTKYLYKTPRILRSEISNLREGLLIGSGCYEGEIFTQARSKTEEELTNMINFYDYVEVQPPECYNHLLQMNDFGSEQELLDNIKKVINTTKDAGKIIIATGDVHHISREDKLYREIIVNQKVPGGGRHPLSRGGIREIPSNHFRTTDEMLKDFSFLDEDLAQEIVVTNTNKIADMVEIIEVIIETGGIPFSPK
ncbi:MAG: PHP domain-containing protein, partial [Firmicutes bacterium]|nr:PHP domain-containing protein [Bacillota bacterium]